MFFKDRTEAGRVLARQLVHYAHRTNVVVLGLPRGGTVLAYEIALVLQAPMDVIITRKIGAPENPELAVGALTESGSLIVNNEIFDKLGITMRDLAGTIEHEREEIKRRIDLYRSGRPAIDLKHKIAILVDDGIATGATMRAALQSAKDRGADKIVVAIAGGPTSTIKILKKEVDELICPVIDDDLLSVGSLYDNFVQVDDDVVILLMKRIYEKHQSSHFINRVTSKS